MSIAAQHAKQARNWENDRDAPDRAAIHESWFREDTVDFWRHVRMYEPALAFTHNSELKWLTIGDGRFGLDSLRIRKLGFTSVLPTDIGDGLLEQAKIRGLIEEYQIADAESLSFDDESFDIVFCKESYHHFPRGPLAIYEMLRVARHAVILVEPRDYTIDRPPNRQIGPVGLAKGLVRWFRYRLKLALNGLPIRQLYQLGDPPDYETVGNYVYSISSRELEKTALGLNLPTLALKGLNDYYEEGVETALAEPTCEVFRRTRDAILQSDSRSQVGIGSTGLLMAILFKTPPDSATRTFLNRENWLLLDLPRNPYL